MHYFIWLIFKKIHTHRLGIVVVNVTFKITKVKIKEVCDD